MMMTKEERVVRLFLAKIEGHVDELVSKAGGDGGKDEAKKDGDVEGIGWFKVNSFLTHADRLIEELQQLHIPTPKDRMDSYLSKTRFLRSVLASISSSSLESTAVDYESLGLKSKLIQRKTKRNSETKKWAAALKPLPKQSTSNARIAQKLMSKQEKSMRDELFDGASTDASLKVFETNDMDKLLKAHQEAQENMAEEMLSLTRSLKEQSMAAGDIVRSDTKKLERAAELAEQNALKLETEAARVAKFNRAKCSGRCFMTALILFVIVVFIAMVLVMRIFKKRVYSQ